MKRLKLTHGKSALVDDVDFVGLSRWKWGLSTSGYAYRRQHIRNGKNDYSQKNVFMHRVVNETPEGFLTDHINRNKLDNRRCNLRTVTKSINEINTPKRKSNKSGFRGVHFDTWSGKWRAEIKKDGKKFSVGRFLKKKDAARAYKEKSLELFGEHCPL